MEMSEEKTTWSMAESKRPMVRPGEGEKDAHGFTPEMRAIAEALTHPEGDPYDNARKMGFYCEQCG